MKKTQRGFTLIELMIVVLVAAILAMVSTAGYSMFVERARVAKAIGGIGEIHIAVQKYLLTGPGNFPADLSVLGLDTLTDPWGNPYQFLVLDGLGNNGAARKDKNLVPVNQQYDVYSMGKDGATASPFTSTSGKDDIVMAGDGTYFGLAEDH
jgi:general secretion pathway protein G